MYQTTIRMITIIKKVLVKYEIITKTMSNGSEITESTNN